MLSLQLRIHSPITCTQPDAKPQSSSWPRVAGVPMPGVAARKVKVPYVLLPGPLAFIFPSFVFLTTASCMASASSLHFSHLLFPSLDHYSNPILALVYSSSSCELLTKGAILTGQDRYSPSLSNLTSHFQVAAKALCCLSQQE